MALVLIDITLLIYCKHELFTQYLQHCLVFKEQVCVTGLDLVVVKWHINETHG